MKILWIACFSLATLLVGYIAVSAPFIARTVNEAPTYGDPSLALQKVRAIETPETLRQAAETFSMLQAIAAADLARYVSYFYLALAALVIALVALGVLARRASNNSFKGMPLRGAP